MFYNKNKQIKLGEMRVLKKYNIQEKVIGCAICRGPGVYVRGGEVRVTGGEEKGQRNGRELSGLNGPWTRRSP